MDQPRSRKSNHACFHVHQVFNEPRVCPARIKRRRSSEGRRLRAVKRVVSAHRRQLAASFGERAALLRTCPSCRRERALLRKASQVARRRSVDGPPSARAPVVRRLRRSIAEFRSQRRAGSVRFGAVRRTSISRSSTPPPVEVVRSALRSARLSERVRLPSALAAAARRDCVQRASAAVQRVEVHPAVEAVATHLATRK